MFSPHYLRARARAGTGPLPEPERFCAVNVALYGPDRRRRAWAFTELPFARRRAPEQLQLSGSQLRWQGDELVVELDERGPWLRRRIRGRIRVHAPERYAPRVPLDAQGHHRWIPIAPRARAQVELLEPEWSFEGHAYLDANHGARPLERDFRGWNWCRLTSPSDPRAIVGYASRSPDEHERGGLYVFDHTGAYSLVASPVGSGDDAAAAKPCAALLPQARWGLRGELPADRSDLALRTRALEDSPFYTRALVRTRLFGHERRGVHEHLDLEAFTRSSTQLMIRQRLVRRRSRRAR